MFPKGMELLLYLPELLTDAQQLVGDHLR